MILSDSTIKMVVTMLLNKLPEGTGENVAEFLNNNVALIEDTKARLERIESKLDAILVKLLEQENNDGNNRNRKPGGGAKPKRVEQLPSDSPV